MMSIIMAEYFKCRCHELSPIQTNEDYSLEATMASSVVNWATCKAISLNELNLKLNVQSTL